MKYTFAARHKRDENGVHASESYKLIVAIFCAGSAHSTLLLLLLLLKRVHNINLLCNDFQCAVVIIAKELSLLSFRFSPRRAVTTSNFSFTFLTSSRRSCAKTKANGKNNKCGWSRERRTSEKYKTTSCSTSLCSRRFLHSH